MTRTAPPADFYRAAGYCAEESVGYLMKRIMLSIVSQADKRLDAHGLTSAQWGPLMRLQATGGATVAELARWLNQDPGAMTRLYQYFPDVEGAVLEIADGMAREGAALKDLVAEKSWAGKSGYQTAEELVEGFLNFWRDNEAILRVVTLGSAEGDKRFFKIRMKILNAVTNSLTDSLKAMQDTGKADKSISAPAVAGSLVAMLAAVAEHQKGFDSWGVKAKELKPSLALLVYLGMTGKKPPK